MSAKADRARLAKWSKSLMNEEFRELKLTCPLCSCIGKFSKLSYTKKRSAKDRTTADRKMSLKRPAVGGESCKQDSF